MGQGGGAAAATGAGSVSGLGHGRGVGAARPEGGEEEPGSRAEVESCRHGARVSGRRGRDKGLRARLAFPAMFATAILVLAPRRERRRGRRGRPDPGGLPRDRRRGGRLHPQAGDLALPPRVGGRAHPGGAGAGRQREEADGRPPDAARQPTPSGPRGRRSSTGPSSPSTTPPASRRRRGTPAGRWGSTAPRAARPSPSTRPPPSTGRWAAWPPGPTPTSRPSPSSCAGTSRRCWCGEVRAGSATAGSSTRKRGAPARAARRRDRPAVRGDDGVADGEPQPHPLAHLPGGEEGIEDPRSAPPGSSPRRRR